MTGILKVDTIQKNNGATPTVKDLGINDAGTILQVVQVVYDTDTSINTTAWTAVSGFAASLTPRDINSKIMIQSTIHVGQGDSTATDFTLNVALARNGNLLTYNTNSSHGYGDIAMYTGNAFDTLSISPYTFSRLDTPSATGLQTYQIYIRTGSPSWSNNPIYLNRTYRFDDAWYSQSRARSTITLMEIAG